MINTRVHLQIFFERKLKAASGETGKTDKAASYEQKKNKYFKYEACRNSSCLVEMDEEPPRNPNSEAIEISLLIQYHTINNSPICNK